MDLWSKGLGKRVLEIELRKRDGLCHEGERLRVRGVLGPPTYWAYRVALGERDVGEFLDLVRQPESLRYVLLVPERREILTAAVSSAVVFAWRTLRRMLAGASSVERPNPSHSREVTDGGS